MGRCHVICFGNELHGDDGFGPRVYQRLCHFSWAAHIRIFNAGTCGLNALNLLEHCRRAILVDALTGSGSPGSVHVFGGDDTIFEKCFERLSHEAGISYLLKAASVLFDPVPDVVIVGVETSKIVSFDPKLSAPVEEAVEQAVELIRERIC